MTDCRERWRKSAGLIPAKITTQRAKLMIYRKNLKKLSTSKVKLSRKRKIKIRGSAPKRA